MTTTPNQNCGCCDGIEKITPLDIANRPDLSAISYRVGTHGSFLATMLTALSNHYLKISSDTEEASLQPAIGAATLQIYPLRGLTARGNDPAIGFLDAWAAVADVLSFYQERIANEGFLRTATERRSILELARLIGYKLRPGVSASVYLAYTLDKIDDTCKGVTIPIGTRAQSVPGPGEMPQSFETSGPLFARPDWNSLQPRLTRPPYITPDLARRVKQNPPVPDLTLDALYFQGLATNLKPNDRLLLVFGDGENNQVLRRIDTVDLQTQNNRTRVGLLPYTDSPTTPISTSSNGTTTGQSLVSAVSLVLANSAASDHLSTNGSNGPVAQTVEPLIALGRLLTDLKRDPSVPPPNSLRLKRNSNEIYDIKSDTAPQLLATLLPKVQTSLYDALANLKVTKSSTLQKIPTLRTKAAVFGHNAPKKPIYDNQGTVIGSEEWPLNDSRNLAIYIVGPRIFDGEGSYTYRQPNARVVVNLNEGSQIIQSAEIALPTPGNSAPVPNLDATISVSVSDGTPVLMVARTTTTNTTIVTITIEFNGDNPFTIVLSEQLDTSIINVTVDKGTPQVLNPGQTLQFTDKANKFQISSEPDELAIEVLTPSPATEQNNKILTLDATYDTVKPESWVAIERPKRNSDPASKETETIITKVKTVQTVSLAAYNISGRAAQLTLEQPWLDQFDLSLAVARATTVYLQSEEWLPPDQAPAFPTATQAKPLLLAEQPLDPMTEALSGSLIELGNLLDGLDSGRWLIVTGERLDLTGKSTSDPATSGVIATELVMIGSVEQRVLQVKKDGRAEAELVDLPGDQTHTFIHLAQPLAYTYKLDTVTIYGNVVKAAHGETRNEALGSGNGSKTMQIFGLHQFPLTYVCAPTPAGTKSTLEVHVNGVLWHETDLMAALGPNDRAYTTITDNDSKTSIIFGNGLHGVRLPTGLENVKAVYRNGIGKFGNVKANQISLLASRPLEVKAVINPLPAMGGADRESRDQARFSIPLSVTTLDRLVSVQDYEDFTHTFAGIGKVSATRIAVGRRQTVHLTLAGVADAPIDPTADLWQNLSQALYQYGDPTLTIQLDKRELLLIVMQVQVKVWPNYQWEDVAPKIRTALLDAFSFENRELGQPIIASQVLSVVQTVKGVLYSDLKILKTIGESDPVGDIKSLTGVANSSTGLLNRLMEANTPLEPSDIWTQPARPDPNNSNQILPAQIAYLSGAVPDALILQEIA